jgi:hypothetical protein
MRSSWIDRLFRQAQGSGQVVTHPSLSLSAFPPRVSGKGRGVEAAAGRALRSRRLCLGIGDGSVHRQ